MHDHSHSHRTDNRRRLALVLLLVVAYMGAEVAGGILSNSLALLADAGHMLSDAAALGLSLFAVWLADRPATPQRTYGYYRTEILAALVNGAALFAVSALIVVETIERFRSPPEVQGLLLFSIATGGLVINLIGLAILNAGRSSSLNVRGAWLHVLSDALGSVGAIVAGVLVWQFGWRLADPIASVIIAVLILHSAWALVAESVGVLMESVPGHVDVDALRQALLDIDGVTGVHDLHVWTITTGMIACSAHTNVPAVERRDAILREATKLLERDFGIHHTTIQIDVESDDCCGMVV